MRSLDDDSDNYHCHDGRKPAGIDRRYPYILHHHITKILVVTINRSRRVLLAASAICLLFMLVEVIAGIWANSLAIITDAAHMLTDLASFLISLFALYLAARPPSQRMSFGWHRAGKYGCMLLIGRIFSRGSWSFLFRFSHLDCHRHTRLSGRSACHHARLYDRCTGDVDYSSSRRDGQYCYGFSVAFRR
jgi:hypothetical protein